MADWVGIKRAVNSTVGTEDFTPIDKMLLEKRATGEVSSLLKTINIVSSSRYFAANTESTVVGSFSFKSSEYSSVPKVQIYCNARSYNSNYTGYIFITSKYSSSTAYSTLNSSSHNGMITCYSSSTNLYRATLLTPGSLKLDTTYYVHVCNKAASTSSSYRTYIYAFKVLVNALCGISTVSSVYSGGAAATAEFTLNEDGYVYCFAENTESEYDARCYIDGNLVADAQSKVTSAPIALSAGTHTFGIGGTYNNAGDYSTSTLIQGYAYLAKDANFEMVQKSAIKSIQYITSTAGLVNISPVNVHKTVLLLTNNPLNYTVYAYLMGPTLVSVTGSGTGRWAVIEFY